MASAAIRNTTPIPWSKLRSSDAPPLHLGSPRKAHRTAEKDRRLVPLRFSFRRHRCAAGMEGLAMKDNSTGKPKDFYSLGKEIFDLIKVLEKPKNDRKLHNLPIQQP